MKPVLLLFSALLLSLGSYPAAASEVKPLPPLPAKWDDKLPLSDQTNQGNWTFDPVYSDDFSTQGIKQELFKVHVYGQGWDGREPGLFWPDNVRLMHGMLDLKYDKITPEISKQIHSHPEKWKYSCFYIGSIQPTLYGCFEILAKPAKVAFANSFWFSSPGTIKSRGEIDVFELGPHCTKGPRNYNMTAHVWSTNGVPGHWATGKSYQLPFDPSDDFHVYGLEWTKDTIKWHIDGSLVRTLTNTNWHEPETLIFDGEPMLDWFGPIDESDIPASFKIKYLRAWRQPGSDQK